MSPSSRRVGTVPPDRAKYDRARALAAQQLWGVHLQLERLRASWWSETRRYGESRADFEFLVGALWRLRRAAMLAATIPPLAQSVTPAVTAFDTALPMLRRWRNVGEHFDSHAFDPNGEKLDSSARGADWFGWLGQRVELDAVEIAANALFGALRAGAPLVGSSSLPEWFEPPF